MLITYFPVPQFFFVTLAPKPSCMMDLFLFGFTGNYRAQVTFSMMRNIP